MNTEAKAKLIFEKDKNISNKEAARRLGVAPQKTYHYMQAAGFEQYRVDKAAHWKRVRDEVVTLSQKYRCKGCGKKCRVRAIPVPRKRKKELCNDCLTIFDQKRVDEITEPLEKYLISLGLEVIKISTFVIKNGDISLKMLIKETEETTNENQS